jgi:hypothetical protein
METQIKRLQVKENMISQFNWYCIWENQKSVFSFLEIYAQNTLFLKDSKYYFFFQRTYKQIGTPINSKLSMEAFQKLDQQLKTRRPYMVIYQQFLGTP